MALISYATMEAKNYESQNMLEGEFPWTPKGCQLEKTPLETMA